MQSVDRLVEDALRRIPLTPPWTVEEFRLWLADDLGVEIDLQPWPPHDDGTTGLPCGVTLIGRDRHLVRYDSRRSLRCQRQSIFHEFGHIMSGHRAEPANLHTQFTKGLDLATLQGILLRSSFHSQAELEAELLGMKLALESWGDVDEALPGTAVRMVSAAFR